VHGQNPKVSPQKKWVKNQKKSDGARIEKGITPSIQLHPINGVEYDCTIAV
jgi:hypothetical protein